MVDGVSPSPKVTVITATYNCCAALKLALQSLLQQSFHDFEAWIIGDACTDQSEQVVQSFQDPRLHWKNLPRNHGSQAFPNNEGLKLARGRYIAYLGHDDLWLSEHLAGLVGAMEQQRADFVHALCIALDPKGVRQCFGASVGTNYAQHFVPPSSWLHTREVVERIGPWRDPDQLAWAVDQDMLIRMHRAQLKMIGVRQATVLKFPSPWFGTYARTDAPQRQWWQRYQNDPQQLQHELMLDIAQLCVQSQQVVDRPLSDIITEPLRTLKRHLVFGYGESRLFHPICRWYFQQHRRRLKKRRGIASAKPS